MKPSEIDLENGVVVIPASNMKGGRRRIVHLDEVSVQILRAVPKPKHDENPLFGSLASNLERYWRQVIRASGVKDFRWHDLRHTAATRMLKAGIDIYKVKELLGHTDIKVTMRYAHLFDQDLKDAVAKLPKVWRFDGVTEEKGGNSRGGP